MLNKTFLRSFAAVALSLFAFTAQAQTPPPKPLSYGPAVGVEQALTNANPIEGGFPLVVDGKIIGAIGISGGTGAQDSATANAGLAALR